MSTYNLHNLRMAAQARGFVDFHVEGGDEGRSTDEGVSLCEAATCGTLVFGDESDFCRTHRMPRMNVCGFGACKMSGSSRQVLAHQAVCPHRERTSFADQTHWVCPKCGIRAQSDNRYMVSHIENCEAPFPLHRAAEVAIPPPVASGRALSFEALAAEIGKLVEAKQAAYGDSFGKSGGILRILYPAGISLTQLDDALTIVRVVDKLFRIATDRDALGENPWKDILGYALLAVASADRGSV